MLITKADLARIAGVSRSAITKACKSGSLKDAMCDEEIDINSEAARKYLRKKRIDPDKAIKKIEAVSSPTVKNNKNGKNSIDFDKMLPGIDFDTKKLERMTLPEICDIFGTDARFKDWTDARKKLTDIEKNEIANAKAVGLLVSREMIQKGVIDPIDAVFATLLTDTAKTVSTRVIAMIKAGSKVEEIRDLIVDQISSVIKPAKVKIVRTIKNA